jgi:hypothetical protein
MYSSIDDLLTSMSKWMEEDVPSKRMKNDKEGRPWFLKSIGYTGTLNASSLRPVVDLSPLDLRFRAINDVKDNKSRKGISAIKAEISMLYSFKRSLIERYKGRLQYYATDMGQKGKRNMAAVGLSLGIFSEFRSNLEA